MSAIGIEGRFSVYVSLSLFTKQCTILSRLTVTTHKKYRKNYTLVSFENDVQSEKSLLLFFLQKHLENLNFFEFFDWFQKSRFSNEHTL